MEVCVEVREVVLGDKRVVVLVVQKYDPEGYAHMWYL